jgi:serine/threonine-protein kinase HipA
VSLSTLRKFEQKGSISLESFLKLLSVIGGLEEVINALKPSKPNFKSIDEVLKTEAEITKKGAEKMKTAIKEIKVGLDFGTGVQSVGRLAIRNGIIYFEYDNDFLQTGIEISPIKLPLKRGLIEFPVNHFEGLAGVFNDSLPDGWGRLLFDRMLRTEGILPSEVTPLDRLAYVGLQGLGALVYEPDQSPDANNEMIDLDVLALQTKEVLEGGSDEVIAELLALNGSSAGARPKALIGVDKERKIFRMELIS